MNNIFIYSYYNMSYTFTEKERLAYQISKLGKRRYFNDIRNIILKNNPSLETTNSSRGILLYFHNLSDTTYKQIENYLNNVDCNYVPFAHVFKSKTHDMEKEDLTKSSESPTEINMDIKSEGYNENDSLPDSIKYSNREKSIIKRKKYDAYINNSESETINSENETINTVFNKPTINI